MSFDFKFLKRNGYELNNVYCTQVAENIIEAGKIMRGNFGLKDTLERNLGLKLDKSIRKDFYAPYLKVPSEKHPLGIINEKYFGITKTWTPELIHYACDDVFFLPALYENQVKRTAERGLEKTMFLEQSLVPETAMMEYRGVRVDMKALLDFEDRMAKEAMYYADKIHKALYDKWWEAINIQRDEANTAYDIWHKQYTEVLEANKEREGRKLTAEAKAARQAIRALKPKVPALVTEFNVDSPEQVKFALAANGIDLPNLQKDNLQDYAGEHAVIDDLISYSKYNKLAEFGLIKNHVGSDGILHPTFNQAGTDTGRYSSSNPNGQNIPARTEEGKQLRACFKPHEGHRFVSADYAAIELVIVGILSDDERLLQAMREGKDLHLWTMSFFLNLPYELLVKARKGQASEEELYPLVGVMQSFQRQMNLPGLLPYEQASHNEHPGLEESANCKEWVDVFRDYIKTITYGLAYGLSSYGLSRKFKCSPEDAQKFIDIFFKVYPQIKSFLDAEGKKGFDQGYSQNINGRRRYYNIPNLPPYGSCSKELYDVMRRSFFRAKSRVMRQSANMVIQSLSADITKLAIAKVARKLKEIGLVFHGLVLTIHDELVLSIPADRVELAMMKLKEAMEESAIQILGNTVPIEVVPKVTDYWSK